MLYNFLSPKTHHREIEILTVNKLCKLISSQQSHRFALLFEVKYLSFIFYRQPLTTD